MRKGYLIRWSWTAGCAERCLSGAGESWNETYCREAARRFLRLTFCRADSTTFHCYATLAGSATQVRLPMPFRDTVGQNSIDLTAVNSTDGHPSVMPSVRINRSRPRRLRIFFRGLSQAVCIV